jgi:dienelactone hydrolase
MKKLHPLSIPVRAASLLAAMPLVAAACAGGTAPAPGPTPRATPTPAPVLAATAPPSTFASAGATWYRVRGDRLNLLLAVRAPDGPGPFPTVVYVPGEAGLDATEVRWAGRLSAAGYLVAMSCPPASGGTDCQPRQPSAAGLDDLVRAAALLPAARRSPVGVVAISAGAAATLAAAANRTDLAAVVADSTIANCSRPVPAPVLLLAGQADAAFPSSEQCARTLTGAETQFFPRGDHLVTLNADTGDAATAGVIDFLGRHLR